MTQRYLDEYAHIAAKTKLSSQQQLDPAVCA
jgi:hypothetical protein